MSLGFSTTQINEPSTEWRSVDGMVDNLYMQGDSLPETITSLFLHFNKQSNFLVEGVFSITWENSGANVDLVMFDFPNESELLPTSNPAITDDYNFSVPMDAVFYYTDTEFVRGYVIVVQESGVIKIKAVPNEPVNLIKVEGYFEYIKSISKIYPVI